MGDSDNNILLEIATLPLVLLFDKMERDNITKAALKLIDNDTLIYDTAENELKKCTESYYDGFINSPEYNISLDADSVKKDFIENFNAKYSPKYRMILRKEKIPVSEYSKIYNEKISFFVLDFADTVYDYANNKTYSNIHIENTKEIDEKSSCSFINFYGYRKHVRSSRLSYKKGSPKTIDDKAFSIYYRAEEIILKRAFKEKILNYLNTHESKYPEKKIQKARKYINKL